MKQSLLGEESTLPACKAKDFHLLPIKKKKIKGLGLKGTKGNLKVLPLISQALLSQEMLNVATDSNETLDLFIPSQTGQLNTSSQYNHLKVKTIHYQEGRNKTPWSKLQKCCEQPP